MTTDGDRTVPAGSRRAQVVLLAAATGVGAALSAAGRHDRSGPNGPILVETTSKICL